VKIRTVTANNRRKAFVIATRRRSFAFPFARAVVRPGRDNRVVDLYVDTELAREAFTYRLESGDEGTIHMDAVLEYAEDPAYMTSALLYRLTVEAVKRVEASPLTTRELIRHLRTSPSQFYRLLDTTNYRKSVRQMLTLLHALDCEVDFIIRDRHGA
jgi:hypothetical protein